MSNTNTGGSAFPVLHWINGESTRAEEGMTLRDYFAAKAMQSLIINSDERSAFEADLWFGDRVYEIADAMLRARQS
jgi:hypothetical protein